MKYATLKLSLKERLSIGALFPTYGNLVEIQEKHEIMPVVLLKVKLTTEETAQARITPREGGGFEWKGDIPDKSFVFTEPEIRYLKDRVYKLHKKHGITSETYSLCEKIADARLVRSKPQRDRVVSFDRSGNPVAVAANTLN